MKVAKSAARVLSSNGVSTQSNFKILANAHSFRILSSGLYSDKISAVLREIGCNAVDSHIAAGCANKPIEVKLPTRLDSDFYIKDFGTGLSHQEILDLYTTYFSSNKSDTNEQTGAFGLGSKSPFSYTDSFSVTSAHGGVQRSYSAFIGDAGAPTIALLDERPVSDDWPHGLLVSFPVSPKDVTEFHEKAKRVFQWFAVTPVFAGSSNPICDAPEFALSGHNFGFLITCDAQGKSIQKRWDRQYGAVLTGNVHYPLDAERLGRLTHVAESLLNAGIFLRMPLGTVMPTASREELEYDERTRANLRSALAEAAHEVAMLIKRTTEQSVPNEWQRKAKVRSFIDRLPAPIQAQLADFIGLLKLPKDKQAEILLLCQDSPCIVASWIGNPAFDAERSDKPRTGKAIARYSVFFIDPRTAEGGEKSVLKRQIIDGAVARGKTREALRIPYKREPEVFFADVDGAVDRVKSYVLNSEVPAILVCPLDAQWKPTAESYAQRVADSLGGVKALAASGLPKPSQKSQRGKTDRPNARLSRQEKESKLGLTELVLVSKTAKGFNSKSVVLKDIPESARFYIPKWNRSLPGIYEVYGHSLDTSRDGNKLYWLLEGLAALAENGVAVPKISGFVFFEATVLGRRDLIKRGFRSLPEAVDEALKNADVVATIKKSMSTLPLIELVDNSYCSDECGLIGALVELAYQHANFRKWLLQALDKLPRTRRLFTDLWRANVLDDTSRTIDAALRTVLTVLRNDLHKRVGVQGNKLTHAYEKLLRKEYPRSALIVEASVYLVPRDLLARTSMTSSARLRG